MIVFLLAILFSVHQRITQPQIENYGFPIYFAREQPKAIRGYVWVEHDYGMQSKYGFPDPGWALYRTTMAPKDNKAVFKGLGVGGEELWSLGRWDDTDWRP